MLISNRKRGWDNEKMRVESELEKKIKVGGEGDDDLVLGFWGLVGRRK